jgi:hypothetical protein
MGSMRPMEHMARTCTNWRSRSRAGVIKVEKFVEELKLVDQSSHTLRKICKADTG